MVLIRLLGRFALRVGDELVANNRFGGRRTRSLLCLLATRRGTLVPRDQLVEALWPEDRPADPAGNLDVLASRGRRALGSAELLLGHSGGLMLAGDERISVDAERFAAAVDRAENYAGARRPAQALAAFQEADRMWAEPLPEETYSDWAEPFRHSMTEIRRRALEQGARTAITLGNAHGAVNLARKAVESDPLREIANLLLVTALGLGGDQAGALAAFDRYRNDLRQELGLDPSEEAFAVQRQILQGVKQIAAASLPALLPRESHDSVREALGRHGSGPMRARTLASIAMIAAGSDDYSRAGELAELAVSEAGSDRRALAESLYAASIVDMNLGNLVRASQRADEALGYFEALGDDAGIADILDGKAMATFMAGRISDGVDAFDRVAKLFTETGDLARVITPRSTKGHGLVFMNKPAEALADVEDALRIAVSLGERESEAYARWHMSEALVGLGRIDDALESASASLAIAEELRHREWTAAALRASGIAHRAAGDLSGAEDAHRRGIDVSDGIPLFETWHAAGLALTLLDAKRVDEAGPWVERAVAGSPPLGLFEARLAHVRLAAATKDPNAPRISEALRRDALEAGHHVIAEAVE